MTLSSSSRVLHRVLVMLVATIATAMVAALLVSSVSTTASAQATSSGLADDTAGVYIYNAGSDTQGFVTPPPLPCAGTPAVDPTNETINIAVNADPPVLFFIGNDDDEVVDWETGTPGEGQPQDDPDSDLLSVTTGLTSVDDYGNVSNSGIIGDDNNNYDTETGGFITLQLTVNGQQAFIVPDGVTTTGVLGSDPSTPFDNLNGNEIFIFEDAELSGMIVELYGPEGLDGPNVSFAVDDYQRNPDTTSAADDTLIAVDLDSLEGFDFPYVTNIKITDDGNVISPNISTCPNGTVIDTSLEIDAVATRTDTVVTGFPAIDIEKTTNGEDADTGPGATITFGEAVNWVYTVTNAGTLDISNVVVTDSQGEAVDCGNGDGTIALLAVDAVVECTASGVAIEGAYENTGTAVGQPVDAAGNATGDPVEDTDRSAYTGGLAPNPSLAVEKTTNGDDADTGPGETLEVGDPVTWEYTVVNDGNVPLTDVTLVDSQGVEITCPGGNPIPNLDVDETVVCTGTGTVVEGPYENTVTATGTAPDGSTTSGEDRSAYTGAVSPGSFGDRIWVDANANGIQDDGETAPPVGLELVLYVANADGTPDTTQELARTTSDTDGMYLFDELDPRVVYAVEITTPDGWIPTLSNQGGDDAVDSDHIGSQFQNIQLETGVFDPTWDYGVFELNPAVDVEKSTNGDQGDTGPGEGILVGEPVVWTYEVTNTGNVDLASVAVTDDKVDDITCPGGNPIATIAVGDSVTCTGEGVATEGPYENTATATGTPLDLEGNPIPGAEVTDDDRSAYTGIPLVSIGDLVFVDANENGRQEGSESGVPGVTVNLWSVNAAGEPDAIIADTVTNADGNYLFEDLPPGTYAVSVAGLPAGYVITAQDAVADDELDSDANPDTFVIAPFDVPPGVDDLSRDVGLIEPKPAIDIEKSTNGDQGDTGPGEGILEGEIVTWTYVVENTGNVDLGSVAVTDDKVADITCPGGNPIALLAVGDSVTCTGEGVATEGPYENTATGTGTPLDSDGNPIPGLPDATDTDRSAYTGIPLVSIGDFIFVDLDENGVQDSGEPGIAGVTVNLWSVTAAGAPDAIIDSAVSDADGAYLFDERPPATYALSVADIPAGFVLTAANVGADDSVDSDADPATGIVESFAVAPGVDDLSHDAGLIAPRPEVDIEKATNGDDADAGPGEGVIVGDPITWTYTVENTGNVALGSVAVTDDKVDDITCPGGNPIPSIAVGVMITCTAEGVAVEGPYENNASASGTPLDRDGNPIPGVEDATDEDRSGYTGLPLVSIGDFVFIDENEDGIQDDGETGLAGATVNLWSVIGGAPSEIIDTVETAANGAYLFDDQRPGSYALSIVMPPGYVLTEANVGNDDTVDSDADPTTGVVAPFELAPGVEDMSRDAGAIPPKPSIDVEKTTNGDQADEGAGETLEVTDPVEWVYTVTNDGNVELIDILVVDSREGTIDCPQTTLDAGETMECTKTGVVAEGSYENNATAQGVPSDGSGNPLAGLAPVEDIDRSAYLGELKKVGIGDYVWSDYNSNGLQDDDETGLAGVRVTLLVVDPDGQTERIDQVTTDNTGFYNFTDLDPKLTYQLQVRPPAGSIVTERDVGDDNSIDSDINPVTGLTRRLTVAPGNNNLTIDAGIAPAPAALGDRVWFDVNSDGIQTEGEAGLEGITVNLWSVNDDATPNEVIATQQTSEAGKYLFTDLDPTVRYIVEFEIAEQYTITALNVGDDATDSDAAIATGLSPVIDLEQGQETVTVDAGVLPLVPSLEMIKRTSGTQFTVGDIVTWTYLVTNDGNVDLRNVVVDDDQEGEICVIPLLRVGAATTCSKSGIAVAGAYENTGSATGTPTSPNPDGSPADLPTTEDESEYEGTEVLPTTLPTRTPTAVPTATPRPTSTPRPTATPVPATPIAVTGTSSGSMTLIAGTMLLAGAAMIVVARRRQDDGAVVAD